MFGSSTSLINSLHAQGRAVVCYIDTAYEDYRPDSSQFTPEVLGNEIDGWPGQRWVDIRYEDNDTRSFLLLQESIYLK
jgi:hypothetical protein